jgi:hypothetical protein
MKEEKLHRQTEDAETNNTLGFLTMLQSTLWAALGVQKHENQKRDFTHGNAYHFIYMGIGFTTFFVCTLVGIVHLVLRVIDA